MDDPLPQDINDGTHTLNQYVSYDFSLNKSDVLDFPENVQIKVE